MTLSWPPQVWPGGMGFGFRVPVLNTDWGSDFQSMGYRGTRTPPLFSSLLCTPWIHGGVRAPLLGTSTCGPYTCSSHPQDADDAHYCPGCAKPKAYHNVSEWLTEVRGSWADLSDALPHYESEKHCSGLGCATSYESPQSLPRSLKSASPGSTWNLSRGGISLERMLPMFCFQHNMDPIINHINQWVSCSGERSHVPVRGGESCEDTRQKHRA